MPYATGENSCSGRLRQEPVGTTGHSDQSSCNTGRTGTNYNNVRWDDGAFDLPLAFGEEFMLVAGEL